MIKKLSDILLSDNLTKSEIAYLLSLSSQNELDMLRLKASEVLLSNVGNGIYLRGLIEFSNQCSCDCSYCGIRKSNHEVRRYKLSKEEIVNTAKFAAQKGFGSVVLQSGEIQSNIFSDFVADCVKTIKQVTKSDNLPNGLGITLCCGEQSDDVYKYWFDMGAHRYLLRIESSVKKLFDLYHPPEQSYQQRLQRLRSLKRIGYQTGTGVIIGLPEQTYEDLAEDILLFRDLNIDMIGMGPYIHHSGTPLSSYKQIWQEKRNDIFLLSLKMIAVARILLKDVNIAATSALGAITKNGREIGLTYGANVIMPLITPINVRAGYDLYEGKVKNDIISEQTQEYAKKIKEEYGRIVKFGKWGDAPHFFNK
jgi:biotin synthase